MQHQIKNLMHMQEDLIMGDVHGQHEWNPSMHISTMTVDTVLKAASTEELHKSAMQHQIRNLWHVHQDLIMGDACMQYEWNPSTHVFTMAADTIWRLPALKSCISQQCSIESEIYCICIKISSWVMLMYNMNEIHPCVSSQWARTQKVYHWRTDRQTDWQTPRHDNSSQVR